MHAFVLGLARKAKEENVFLRIEHLSESGIKGEDLEQKLSSKLSISTEQAKDWIRKYEEYKTSRGSQIQGASFN